MLVKREVFDKIRERYPELWVPKCGKYYEQMGLKGGVLQAFECFPGKDGMYIGEDYAFCDRWVQGCEGEIWCCVNETITHTVNRNSTDSTFASCSTRPCRSRARMRQFLPSASGQGGPRPSAGRKRAARPSCRRIAVASGDGRATPLAADDRAEANGDGAHHL